MKIICKSLFFLLTFMFFIQLNAQNVGVDWGRESKGDYAKGSIKSLGWHDDNYYTIQRRLNNVAKNVYYFEKIDKNKNLVFSKKLENKNYGISFAKILNNQLYLFQIRNQQLSFKKIEVYYNVYNLNGEFIKEVVLAEFTDLKKFNQLNDSYFFEASENGNHIAFAFLDKHHNENYIRLVNGIIKTDKLEKAEIYSTNIEVSDDIFASQIGEFFVSDNGELLNTVGTKNKEKDPFLYQFITLDKEKNYLSPIFLNSENVYFNSIDIEKVGGNIMFSGMIVTKGKSRNLNNGFFLAQMDIKENQIQDLSTFIYSEEFFQSLGYKVKNNGRVKFRGSYTLDIVSNQDGSGYLIAEHTGIKNKYYAREEVICLPFDKEGKLGKDKIVLLKNQTGYTANNGGMGYFAFSKDNQLHVLYNGVIKNLEINQLDDLKTMKDVDDNKSATILATLVNGEKFKREILFTYKNQKGYLVPSKCSDEEGEYIISVLNKKKIRYGKLQFN